MAPFQEDIRILDLELFDAAEHVTPGNENEAKRRFMTLFVHEGHGRQGECRCGFRPIYQLPIML